MARSPRETDRLGCRQVRRVLQAYLDGEIGTGREELVAAHLESCSRCRIEADTLQQVIETLQAHRPDLDLAAYTRLRRTVDDLLDRDEAP